MSARAPHRPGYQFPDSAAIGAGGSVRVHAGCGANTATDLYWCQRSSVFENVTHDARHMGDGAYLFDPQGDLRALQIFPCTGTCGDALAGRVRITAHPTTPESISVTNVTGEVADLSRHVVKLHFGARADQYIFSYAIPFGTALAPGQTLRLRVDGDPADDTPLERNLGRPSPSLADGGNAVSLRSFTDVVVDCFAWGNGTC